MVEILLSDGQAISGAKERHIKFEASADQFSRRTTGKPSMTFGL